MTIEEINQYISFGSRSNVCVYREEVTEVPLIIMSLYITGSRDDYMLTAEFDPIDMIDNGEGWVWYSEFTDINLLVEKLEVFMNAKIDSWENITKTGKLAESFLDVDNDDYLKQEEMFLNKFSIGKVFLPTNIPWMLKSLGTLVDNNKLH